MAINPKLKEYLDKVQMTDDYRKKLVDALEEAPADVQNLWMAQQDYTRNINAFNAEKAEWKQKADKFYDDSNKNIDAWKNEVQKANDAVKQAEARIAELQAGAGGGGANGGGGAANDLVSAEIKRLEGVITQLNTGIDNRLKAVLDERLKAVVTPQDLNQAYANAVGFIGEQTIKLRGIERKYEKTFGGEFDEKKAEELISFANEQSKKLGRQISLDDAYTMKYGDDIQKKHDEQVAAAAIEKYKTTQEPPTGGSPAGGGMGAPEKGPLQIRMDQLRAADSGKKEGVYQTWQEAAAAGADELVKEGKY